MTKECIQCLYLVVLNISQNIPDPVANLLHERFHSFWIGLLQFGCESK